MMVLIVLMLLALGALLTVNIINRKQALAQARRMQQRKLKLEADAIVDIVNCIEQTLPNPMFAKHINDENIALLEQILALETGNTNHIEHCIRHAKQRSEDLAKAKRYATATYQKASDAQIKNTQLLLNQAAVMLQHLCAQGKLTEAERQVFTGELEWAFLMVSVCSFISQGAKFSAMHDRFSAHNYYRKAQSVLMESLIQDPRRMRMIKELGEIIEGSRSNMSRDLLPEPVSAD